MIKIKILDAENKQCELDKGEESFPMLSQDEFKLDRSTLNNVVIEFEDSKEESTAGPAFFVNTDAGDEVYINLDMNQVYNETTIKDVALKDLENENCFWNYFVKIGGLAGIFTLAIVFRDLLMTYFCLKIKTSTKANICLIIVIYVLTLLICIGSFYI